MGRRKAPPTLPNVTEGSDKPEKQTKPRKPRTIRSLDEQLRDAESRVEMLRRKKITAALEGSDEGRQIDLLMKAKTVLVEREEERSAEDLEMVIQGIAKDAGIDLS